MYSSRYSTVCRVFLHQRYIQLTTLLTPIPPLGQEVKIRAHAIMDDGVKMGDGGPDVKLRAYEYVMYSVLVRYSYS